VLSLCGNSFKTVGKAFQVKLVERMQRVCKVVIKAIKVTLKNLKYKVYFYLFNTFLVTTWFNMFLHYYSTIKKIIINKLMFANFWLVLHIALSFFGFKHFN
jgi:hypothetical protein